MGIFDHNLNDNKTAKTLVSDALAAIQYTYHNMDNGLYGGYQKYGIESGIVFTGIEAILGSFTSQGMIPFRFPWTPDSELQALENVTKAGWTVISADQLGYTGKVDSRGTFFGESFWHNGDQAEILGKYGDNGKLESLTVAFRGTSGPRESMVQELLTDIRNDLFLILVPGFAENYAKDAFNQLLTNVADFATVNGLSGEDVLVTGHSLGGAITNSVATLSGDNWNEFYQSANFVSFASPTQYELENKVLNVGFENDPIFRALDGTSFNLNTLLSHDDYKESATNNIVNFTDFYASVPWNIVPFSALNLTTWISHIPDVYNSVIPRIVNSEFYDLTYKDSTVIVANLSNVKRDNTWIEDLNRDALPRTGSTFIIGSDGNDFIKGGRGNDYLEGGHGNDTFRDEGGYNSIIGGNGYNLMELQKTLGKVEVASDNNGTLYLRDAEGEITIARDIQEIKSKETVSLPWFSKDLSHAVTEEGLQSTDGLIKYATSVVSNSDDDIVLGQAVGGWLFGFDGNDNALIGSLKNDTFVGGEGNDTIYINGGEENTLFFEGDFGSDTIYGFKSSDKLVFMGTDDSSYCENYLEHTTVMGNDLLMSFGDSSIKLVGVNLDSLDGSQIIMA